MIIKLKSRIKPTEDEEKVIMAVKNIFKDAKVVIEDNQLIGEAEDISRFKELLRSQAILDTARMVLEKGIVGNSTKFKINKQAAFAGLVNFDKDIHGGIFVKLIAEEDKDLMKLIKDIAPKTKNGKIIDEDEEINDEMDK
ncbi:RNA-binding domain-containing protein [Methanothermococcus sp.]|uniref:RNA-binding domain-containing protein n=1 Tax=Methanothermococcus sp. TaxID=2614238 RepID=UPI0025F49FF3|nr:RNA-binding domain-containing protein [Methanothermococcus sp.]